MTLSRRDFLEGAAVAPIAAQGASGVTPAAAAPLHRTPSLGPAVGSALAVDGRGFHVTAWAMRLATVAGLLPGWEAPSLTAVDGQRAATLFAATDGLGAIAGAGPILEARRGGAGLKAVLALPPTLSDSDVPLFLVATPAACKQPASLRRLQQAAMAVEAACAFVQRDPMLARLWLRRSLPGVPVPEPNRLAAFGALRTRADQRRRWAAACRDLPAGIAGPTVDGVFEPITLGVDQRLGLLAVRVPDTNDPINGGPRDVET